MEILYDRTQTHAEQLMQAVLKEVFQEDSSVEIAGEER